MSRARRLAGHGAVGFVLSQVGWFGCVGGAAAGLPWVGPVVVGAVVGVHLWIRDDRRAAALLLVAAGAVGLGVDSALVAAGALDFPDATRLVPGFPGTTLWMVALWVGFATTLPGALRSIARRPVAAAAMGAVFGPLGYRAGVAMGAATLGEPAAASLAAIALAWALALPALGLLDERLTGPSSRA